MMSEKQAQKFHLILMMHHYSDLISVSDWSCRKENFVLPMRSTTQIWVVTYGISTLVSKMSFVGETRGSVTKCQLFSQAKLSSSFYSLHIPNNLKHYGQS